MHRLRQANPWKNGAANAGSAWMPAPCSLLVIRISGRTSPGKPDTTPADVKNTSMAWKKVRDTGFAACACTFVRMAKKRYAEGRTNNKFEKEYKKGALRFIYG